MEIKELTPNELNLPEDPGRAPQINWGREFNELDKDNQIRYLKKLCSALNHATDLIQKERNELVEKCHKVNEQLKNSEKIVGIRKDTLVNALTEHNAEKQKLIKRLQELERDNKGLTVRLRKYEEV